MKIVRRAGGRWSAGGPAHYVRPGSERPRRILGFVHPGYGVTLCGIDVDNSPSAWYEPGGSVLGEMCSRCQTLLLKYAQETPE